MRKLIGRHGLLAVAALWILLGLLPLVMLTSFSITLSDSAVRGEVRDRVSTTASVSRVVVEQQMGSLKQLVSAFARRPEVKTGGKDALPGYLEELSRLRDGVTGVIVVRSDGRTLGAAPPSGLPQDLSTTDWYLAIRNGKQAYVSQAYTPTMVGVSRAVAVAAPIPGTDEILAVVYSLDAIQDFASQAAEAQGIRLLITDQAGVLVADRELYALTSLREDPRVDAALAGRSLFTAGHDALSASEPIPGIGWTVTAEVPAASALATASQLRTTVLAIAGLLAVLIMAGLGVQIHTTRARRRAQLQLGVARDAAVRASLAKSEFVAKVSHEIRTPINGVLGMNALLLDTPLDDEQRHYAGTVHASARNLLGLLDDFLDLSKIEAGRLEVELVPFDLVALCEEAVAPLRPAAARQGLWLRLRHDCPARIVGDPVRLRQVLANLLGNALKFTSRGGIDLDIEVAGSVLRFTVTDTGMGVAAADRERVFEEFRQVDSPVTRRSGGSGLGLAICRQLVGLMGGEIGLDSVQGVGSRFWFTLPLLPGFGADLAPDPAAGEVAAGWPARILVAEDDPVSRQVAGLVLAKAGHEVDVVEDGEHAVRAALAGDYDLVFMDCQLPLLDGPAATAEIRRREEWRVPIVAMTASAMPQDRERCLTAGMDEHLVKPVDWAEVVARIPEWTLFAHLAAALESLESAVSDGDIDQVIFFAHRLRGSCATVRAADAAALCQVVEEQGRELSSSELALAVSQVNAAVTRIR